MSLVATLLPTAARNITMADGLCSYTVRALAQDQRGFIWMGTDGGLCRYDGSCVQPFLRTDVADQYVSAILPMDKGLVVGTSRGAVFFRFADERFTAISQKAQDGVAMTASVSGIVADRDSNVWIATKGQGLFCYTPASHELYHLPAKAADGYLLGVYVDNRNQVYALCEHGRYPVLLLDRATGHLNGLTLADDVVQGRVMAMLRLADGSFLYGTWRRGLVSQHGTLNPADQSLYHIHALLQQPSGTVLVGTDAGIFVYNPADQSLQPLQSSIHRPLYSSIPSLSPKFVYSIVSDREGGLWYSTFYGGVFYESPMDNRFRSFAPETSPLLHGNIVSRFCEDARHRIWVASDDGGIDCYDPATGQMVNFAARSRLSTVNAHAFQLIGEDLWIGTYAHGVLRMNTATGNVTAVDGAPSSVYSFCLDRKGRLWVGTLDGVCLANANRTAFSRVKIFGSLTSDIVEDKQGNLWFATQEHGLWRLDNGGRWHHYEMPAAGHAQPIRQINDLSVAHDGCLLVATPHGLFEWQQAKSSFALLPIEAPTNNIAAVVEDAGALWLSTDQGILRYSPADGLQTFNRYDGIAGEQFRPVAALKGSDGCIYFGSLHGFSCFYPYQVKVNSHEAPVVITRFDILGKPVEAGTDRLPEALTAARRLDIYAADDMVAIHFASLSYCSPEKIRYAYMLDGFDKTWHYTMTPAATYTDLPAGTYTFRVRATNSDGLWTADEARLTVVVHPPLWWSWPARLVYLLLVVCAVWFYVHLRLKAADRRHRRDLRRLNERKDLEVKEARLRFFTMIAHEIRTPVSLIIGPLETLMRHVANHTDDSVLAADGDSLKMIDRNAHRLLDLVNQLLDFNKVQQAGMEMRFAEHNIYDLVHAVTERFAPTLEQKGARFTVDYPPETFTAVVDAEAVTKVISNLMTNATKYTRSLVALSCSLAADGKTFTITVADDGVGISPADQKKIFGAFYQAQDNKPGTGIGLAIVDNIVKMHGGTVSVASQVGRGATFTVVLPTRQKMSDAATPEPDGSRVADDTVHREPVAPVTPESAQLLSPADHPYLLIVDDNTDMLRFLTDNFHADYTVITAQNGEDALVKLRANPIAMIISDWMMPVMDGAEFCRRVRADRRFSHIPFVMLTAKTDDSTKTESMNCGADAYIEKPFSMEYLQACIRNMLDMRRHLFQMFSTTPEATVSDIEASPVDSELLQQMTKIIEEHIDSKELSVNYLAEQLNMSRSGLFAKVKAITDVTPNELIQIVRLKRAAQLLREGKYRINEVSYMVGFSSPSYFSKCFTKQFGKKPGEFK